MDQRSVSNLVVEEQHGWTIVSSLEDENQKKNLKTETDTGIDLSHGKSVDVAIASEDPKSSVEDNNEKAHDQKIPLTEDEKNADPKLNEQAEIYKEEENTVNQVDDERNGNEDKEKEGYEKANLEKEGQDSTDQSYENRSTEVDADDGAADGYGYHQTSVMEFVEAQNAASYPWETQEAEEHPNNLGVVQQQPDHKPGVMWRASLVATLGFFGWVVLSGINGNRAKNMRCLKIHPCSIKSGEPAVLNTL